MKDNFSHFKDKFLTDIESGVVAIEPKWKVLLPKILVGCLTLLAFLLTVLVFSYILFAIRAAGHSVLLGFGAKGILFFLAFFPWAVLAFDILLIIAVFMLARRFSFGWKTPRLYLLIGILTAAVAAGALLDGSLNDTMVQHRGALPAPVGVLYSIEPPERKGLVRGEVLNVGEEFIVIKKYRTGELIEVVPVNGRVEFEIGRLSIGESVMVAGEEIDGVIEAFGVRGVYRE